MKVLRPVLLSALLTTGIFGSVLYTGCKDKCGSTTCANGGTCSDNKCSCPTGYSGTTCATGMTDGLLGSYDCSRANCNPVQTGVNAWRSVISRSSTNGGYTFNISNFNNANIAVSLTVDSNMNVTTNLATGQSGISARGKFASGKMTLHFTTFSAAGGVEGPTCDMTMVKL